MSKGTNCNKPHYSLILMYSEYAKLFDDWFIQQKCEDEQLTVYIETLLICRLSTQLVFQNIKTKSGVLWRKYKEIMNQIMTKKLFE